MSKLLKEPLLHLLVLGAALFGEKFAAAPRTRGCLVHHLGDPV